MEEGERGKDVGEFGEASAGALIRCEIAPACDERDAGGSDRLIAKRRP